jgi:hypothetical protein
MLGDYAWKALHAALITLVIMFAFVTFFWAFRGFLPASRLVTSPPGTGGVSDEADFNFYYVTWCPFSEDALPAVKSLKTLVQGSLYGGRKVKVNLINCEIETSKCRLAGVDSYPTYVLSASDKTRNYSGPPKTATYEEFLISALGPKTTPPPPSAPGGG